MKLVLISILSLSFQLFAQEIKDAKLPLMKSQAIITSDGPFPTIFIPSKKVSPAEKQAKQEKVASEKNAGSLTYAIGFPGTRQLARNPDGVKGRLLNISGWLLLLNMAVQSGNFYVAQNSYKHSSGLGYFDYLIIQSVASSAFEATLVTNYMLYNSTTEFSKLRNSYSDSAQNSNLAVGLFVGLYALNIFDSIVFSKPGVTAANANNSQLESGFDFKAKVQTFPVVAGNSYINNRETNYTFGWRHVW